MGRVGAALGRLDPRPVGLSLAFWGLVSLLRPFQNQPLNDDWIYAYSAWTLAESGSLRIMESSVAAVASQAFWGAGFSLLLGPGYGPLRLSTLLLAWAAGLAFYRFLSRGGSGRNVACAAAALLLFNPLWFVLAPSFMTDVPAVAWGLLALCLSWHGFRQDPADLRWVALGSAFSALALGVRQNCLLLPAGMTLWLAMRRRLDARSLLCLWVLPAAAVATHQAWYHLVHGRTVNYHIALRNGLLPNLEHPGAALAQAIRRMLQALIYCGLFVSPLAASFWLDRPLERLRKARLTPPVALVSGAMLLFLLFGGWLPYPGTCNYLGTAGLGCFSLPGTPERDLPLLGRPWFWEALSLAAWASWTTVMLAGPPAPGALFVALPLGLVFLSTLAYTRFYDRYILPLAPAALAWALPAAGTLARSRATLWTATALLAAFSWAGTYDYLRVSEAAWGLGREAVSKGMEPSQIWASSEWCWSQEYVPGIAELKRLKPVDRISLEETLDICRRPHKAAVSFDLPGRVPRLPISSAEFFSPLSLRVERLRLLSLQ